MSPPRPFIPRKKTLSAEDQALWAEFARNLRVMPGRALPPRPEPAKPAAPAPPQAAAVSAAPPKHVIANHHLTAGIAPAGLDRASWQRFAAAKLPIESRLDLHGRTVEAAFHALTHFLTRARTHGTRHVEIVTGLGTGERGGAIRHELPFWLNLPSLRPHILAVTYSNARNQGAVRLLLRR